MARFLNDCRFALRFLLRGRSTTAFAVTAFALGIGITTAVFTIFYGVLLKPLPYPNPDQLVIVYDTQPACTTCPASYTKYIDWRTRGEALFAQLGGSSSQLAVITGSGDPERVPMARVTWTLADVFGVNAARGRWFTEDEDKPGGPKVVVFTDAYWARRFNRDPNIVGRKVTIDDEPFEVVGVMRPDFAHRRADIFLPVQRAFDEKQRGNHFLQVYARLKPGVTPERAQKEMQAIGGQLAQQFGHNHGIDVQPYFKVIVGNVIQPLRILMGAVLMVLLIACANVANLLLASGLARRRELAVRSALGATRADLARQLTVEGIVLALAGGVLGLGLAQWTISTFIALADTALPRATTLGIDLTVVGFALGLSLLVGIICGLWPVFRLSSRTIGSDVREGDLRSGSQAGGRKFGNGLVVAEIALAFSLLVGAGLLVKNLVGLEARETGFKTERVVAFDLSPTGTRYQPQDKTTNFYRELAPKLATVPGVVSVGLTSHLPMYQFGWNGEVSLEGGNPWQPREAPLVERAWIGAKYFETMGIDIVKGRNFDDRDRQGATQVTIISERTAEKFWPGQNPIGRRFDRNGGSFGGSNANIVEVVGVARNTLHYGLTSQSPYILYRPIEQEPFGAMTVVLKTQNADPTTVMPSVRQVVASIDPLLPVARIQTVEHVVMQTVTQPRLISSLTTVFGGLAGVLAAVGVYGVMAYNVRRQRREFGIRLALGADPQKVRALVVKRGLVLGLLGITLGAAMALWLTRLMQSMLSGVESSDPMVFGLTGAGLLAVTVLAGYIPARQASRTSPMIVLRTE